MPTSRYYSSSDNVKNTSDALMKAALPKDTKATSAILQDAKISARSMLYRLPMPTGEESSGTIRRVAMFSQTMIQAIRADHLSVKKFNEAVDFANDYKEATNNRIDLTDADVRADLEKSDFEVTEKYILATDPDAKAAHDQIKNIEDVDERVEAQKAWNEHVRSNSFLKQARGAAKKGKEEFEKFEADILDSVDGEKLKAGLKNLTSLTKFQQTAGEFKDAKLKKDRSIKQLRHQALHSLYRSTLGSDQTAAGFYMVYRVARSGRRHIRTIIKTARKFSRQRQQRRALREKAKAQAATTPQKGSQTTKNMSKETRAKQKKKAAKEAKKKKKTSVNEKGTKASQRVRGKGSGGLRGKIKNSSLFKKLSNSKIGKFATKSNPWTAIASAVSSILDKISTEDGAFGKLAWILVLILFLLLLVILIPVLIIAILLLGVLLLFLPIIVIILICVLIWAFISSLFLASRANFVNMVTVSQAASAVYQDQINYYTYTYYPEYSPRHGDYDQGGLTGYFENGIMTYKDDWFNGHRAANPTLSTSIKVDSPVTAPYGYTLPNTEISYYESRNIRYFYDGHYYDDVFVSNVKALVALQDVYNLAWNQARGGATPYGKEGEGEGEEPAEGEVLPTEDESPPTEADIPPEPEPSPDEGGSVPDESESAPQGDDNNQDEENVDPELLGDYSMPVDGLLFLQSVAEEGYDVRIVSGDSDDDGKVNNPGDVYFCSYDACALMERNSDASKEEINYLLNFNHLPTCDNLVQQTVPNGNEVTYIDMAYLFTPERTVNMRYTGVDPATNRREFQHTSDDDLTEAYQWALFAAHTSAAAHDQHYLEATGVKSDLDRLEIVSTYTIPSDREGLPYQQNGSLLVAIRNADNTYSIVNMDIDDGGGTPVKVLDSWSTPVQMPNIFILEWNGSNYAYHTVRCGGHRLSDSASESTWRSEAPNLQYTHCVLVSTVGGQHSQVWRCGGHMDLKVEVHVANLQELAAIAAAHEEEWWEATVENVNSHTAIRNEVAYKVEEIRDEMLSMNIFEYNNEDDMSSWMQMAKTKIENYMPVSEIYQLDPDEKAKAREVDDGGELPPGWSPSPDYDIPVDGSPANPGGRIDFGDNSDRPKYSFYAAEGVKITNVSTNKDRYNMFTYTMIDIPDGPQRYLAVQHAYLEPGTDDFGYKVPEYMYISLDKEWISHIYHWDFYDWLYTRTTPPEEMLEFLDY